MIKELLKLVIPKSARMWLREHTPLWFHVISEPVRLLVAYIYDFRRYRKYYISQFSDRRYRKYFISQFSDRPYPCRLSDDQIRAYVVMHAHSIERGLSLPDVRPFFGEQKLRLILDLTAEIESRRSGLAQTDEFQLAREALMGYIAWHKHRGFDAIECFGFLAPYDCPPARDGEFASNLLLRRDEILARARGNFEEVMNSRYSIREFAAGGVDEEEVHRAMKLAGKTPTVCNRQGHRVHIITDIEKVRKALSIQGGSSGFIDDVPAVLVISSKLPNFFSVFERNQAFVDGGLYGMSLMLSLHYYGIASCPLNWCQLPETDMRFRKAFGFPDDEVIVMFLAIGQMPDELLVPASKRYEFLTHPRKL